MSKKSIAMLLALILAVSMVSIAGCGGDAAPAESSGDTAQPSGDAPAAASSGESVKIGTPTYLTGTGGFVGNEGVYGIRLAIAEKETLWGKPIEYIPVDGVDNSKMPSAAEYLLNVENVELFLMASNNVPGAMQSVIQPKGGFQVELGNWTPTVIDSGYENHVQYPMMYDIFAWNALDIILEDIAPIIGKSRDDVKLGILCVGFWQPIADAITVGLEERGITPVFFEVYQDDISDFTPLIAKMKQAEVDILFHTARTPDCALFLKQSYAQQYRPPIVIGNGLAYDQPEYAELAEAGEGTLGFSWPVPGMNEEKLPQLKEFKENYRAMHDREPMSHSITAYCGAVIALQALENAGEMDNAQMKQAFMEMEVDSYVMPNLWGFKLVEEGGKSAYNEGSNVLVLSQWVMTDSGLEYQVVWPDDVSVREAEVPFTWFQ